MGTRLVTYNIVAHIKLTIFCKENSYSMLTLTNCDAHLNHKHTIVAFITITMCFLHSQKKP